MIAGSLFRLSRFLEHPLESIRSDQIAGPHRPVKFCRVEGPGPLAPDDFNFRIHRLERDAARVYVDRQS
jgi:hypothetical protein